MTLTFDYLVTQLRNYFKTVTDPRTNTNNNVKIPLLDVLMGAFALFSLKDSSVLKFVNEFNTRRENLRTVYGIESKQLSDSSMRGILDGVSPKELQSINRLFIKDLAEETNLLDEYVVLDNYLACSVDGTLYFSSDACSCPSCLKVNHKDGRTTYQHKCLAAVLVHPDKKEVFPFDSEDIIWQDGQTKNDCELNAAKRFIPRLSSPIAGTKLLFLEDALYGNGPHIKLLLDKEHSFIINIKPGSQGTLYAQFNRLSEAGKTLVFKWEDDYTIYRYEYVNGLFLNGEYPDIIVNMMVYREIDKRTGKIKKKFDFMTDIMIHRSNVNLLVATGRSRWKIENETFNTLKNQGYNYEHNYGHGNRHLATNFSIIMFLAFLVDQIIQAKDSYFKSALVEMKSKKALWEKVRQVFDLVEVKDMKTIYRIIAKEIKLKIKVVVSEQGEVTIKNTS